MTVIMHGSMARSLAFILANKLQSSTLLATQLTRLFIEAYEVGRGGAGGLGGRGGAVERWGCCDGRLVGCRWALPRGGASKGWLPLRSWACCAAPPHTHPAHPFPLLTTPLPHCLLPPPPCLPPLPPVAAAAAAPQQDQPCLVEAAVADLQAVMERDPACTSSVHPLLFFKGYQVWEWGWWSGECRVGVECRVGGGAG